MATRRRFLQIGSVAPVMPKASTNGVDYGEISMTQISQQIMPAGRPKMTVCGYGSVNLVLLPNRRKLQAPH
jgi:hypothetical protein